MALSGTLLNIAAVLAGTVVGLLAGARMPPRVGSTLTDGLGLFTLALGLVMALSVFTDPAALPGDDLAVLGALLVGAALGEALRFTERLDGLGGWFQRRLARGGRPSRISEGYVTASLVFCVGPLTILGSIENGITGDVRLLAIKSLLDGVASIAFAAALGPGVALSALTILVVQGGIALTAALFGAGLDERSILGISATGGFILLGVGLRLLEVKAVRVASFLPALLIAPLLLGVAAAIRTTLAP
jgi:uncharacterized membrane protein YqgA involved in biofilm formation